MLSEFWIQAGSPLLLQLLQLPSYIHVVQRRLPTKCYVVHNKGISVHLLSWNSCWPFPYRVIYYKAFICAWWRSCESRDVLSECWIPAGSPSQLQLLQLLVKSIWFSFVHRPNAILRITKAGKSMAQACHTLVKWMPIQECLYRKTHDTEASDAYSIVYAVLMKFPSVFATDLKCWCVASYHLHHKSCSGP